MKTPAVNQAQLPALLLRVGLASMFLYAGIDSLLHPENWVGFLPDMLTERFDPNVLLKFFAVYELALGALLLSGLYVRYVALLAAATLAGIVITNFHILLLTFRDIGLMFAALALAAMKQK